MGNSIEMHNFIEMNVGKFKEKFGEAAIEEAEKRLAWFKHMAKQPHTGHKIDPDLVYILKRVVQRLREERAVSLKVLA